MSYRRFEEGVREWLKEACREGHPLASYWVRDHLQRVDFARRFHLPVAQEFLGLRGARVLDLGCGTAGTAVAFDLAGGHSVGLDLSYRKLSLGAIRAAEDGAAPLLIQADARALPFCAEAFDLCVCDVVIEHVHDYPVLLAGVHRVLRPAGIAIVSVPHRLALREPHTGLLFASWLPHRWAGAYAALRRRRMPGEAWDVWLELPWTIRRRFRECGFLEVRSPWRQPRRPPAEQRGLRGWLARIPALASLVRGVFRWRNFLSGNLTFVLAKPRPDSARYAGNLP
jgi:SAM-dependent methyltransferase